MIQDIRIRSRFIHKVFKEEGARLLEKQGKAISSRTHERTGTLMRTRHVAVYGGNGESIDGMMSLTHTVYERFLDMRHLDGRKHKRRIIHNRFVMQAYGRIAYRMMNEFTSDVQEQLKQEIESIRHNFER